MTMNFTPSEASTQAEALTRPGQPKVEQRPLPIFEHLAQEGAGTDVESAATPPEGSDITDVSVTAQGEPTEDTPTGWALPGTGEAFALSTSADLESEATPSPFRRYRKRVLIGGAGVLASALAVIGLAVNKGGDTDEVITDRPPAEGIAGKDSNPVDTPPTTAAPTETPTDGLDTPVPPAEYTPGNEPATTPTIIDRSVETLEGMEQVRCLQGLEVPNSTDPQRLADQLFAVKELALNTNDPCLVEFHYVNASVGAEMLQNMQTTADFREGNPYAVPAQSAHPDFRVELEATVLSNSPDQFSENDLERVIEIQQDQTNVYGPSSPPERYRSFVRLTLTPEVRYKLVNNQPVPVTVYLISRLENLPPPQG